MWRSRHRDAPTVCDPRSSPRRESRRIWPSCRVPRLGRHAFCGVSVTTERDTPSRRAISTWVTRRPAYSGPVDLRGGQHRRPARSLGCQRGRARPGSSRYAAARPPRPQSEHRSGVLDRQRAVLGQRHQRDVAQREVVVGELEQDERAVQHLGASARAEDPRPPGCRHAVKLVRSIVVQGETRYRYDVTTKYLLDRYSETSPTLGGPLSRGLRELQSAAGSMCPVSLVQGHYVRDRTRRGPATRQDQDYGDSRPEICAPLPVIASDRVLGDSHLKVSI
jgi:hypothetical protein